MGVLSHLVSPRGKSGAPGLTGLGVSDLLEEGWWEYGSRVSEAGGGGEGQL